MNILLIAGTHGVEPQSEYIARKLAEDLCKKAESNGAAFDLYKSDSLTVIPNLNKYGLEKNTRTNANGVDLNRNMPSKNWSKDSTSNNPDYNPGTEAGSEAETKALVEIIKGGSFDFVISMHTTHFVEFETPPQTNFDFDPSHVNYQAAQNRAKKISKTLELPFTEDIGYPCPGSLGSYCAEIGIPCITIELDNNLSQEKLWEIYSNKLKHILN